MSMPFHVFDCGTQVGKIELESGSEDNDDANADEVFVLQLSYSCLANSTTCRWMLTTVTSSNPSPIRRRQGPGPFPSLSVSRKDRAPSKYAPKFVLSRHIQPDFPFQIVKCPNCFKPFSSKHVCDAGPENQSTARKDNATESAIETRSAKFRKEKKVRPPRRVLRTA